MAVESDSPDLFFEAVAQTIPHPLHVQGVPAEVALRQFAGLSQGRDPGDVFRSCAPSALVPCAVHEFFKRHVASHVKRSDPLGGINLVSRHGQEVHAELLHGGGDFPRRLGGVGVKKNTALPGHLRDLFNGLNRSHLVIGVHDRDEDRLRRQDLFERFQVDQPRPVHGNGAHSESHGLKMPADLCDGRMLDGGGDNMAPVIPPGESGALDGMVVGFRSAAGENNFDGIAIEKIGRLAPGLFDGLSGFDAVSMGTGRISKVIGEERPHGLVDVRIDGRGGVVIQVDGFHRPSDLMICEISLNGAAPADFRSSKRTISVLVIFAPSSRIFCRPISRLHAVREETPSATI